MVVRHPTEPPTQTGYLGALRVLDERGDLAGIQRVGGTSAGAINATLVGLGYSVADTERILESMDFASFMDHSWGYLRDIRRLLREFGWYKGDTAHRWIEDVVAGRTGDPRSTFAEVKARAAEEGFLELAFVGANLSTGDAEVFSAERTPGVAIADAVRISMSLPLFFAARRIGEGVYVDGGLLNNYPVKLFDREHYLDPDIARDDPALEPSYYAEANREAAARGEDVSRHVFNKQTLGFRLDSAQEIAVYKEGAELPARPIENLAAFTQALMKALLDMQDRRHLHSDDWKRTVYIDTLGVQTTDFTLDEGTQRALVASGEAGTRKYFAWRDGAAW